MTVVLVHGAGHTAAVWQRTQQAMATPSLAFDLPGRGSRPADLSRVSVHDAAESLVQDINDALGSDGEIVLVAHSVAGTILPSVAARLSGRVRHLVFIAGITAAAEGALPCDTFLPGRSSYVAERMEHFRHVLAGRSLEDMEPKTAGAVDSLNFGSQPFTWAGIDGAIERTFIRCLRDPIQSPQLQAQLIANCGAATVLDIHSHHTPAIDAPVQLAALLDAIVARAKAAA